MDINSEFPYFKSEAVSKTLHSTFLVDADDDELSLTENINFSGAAPMDNKQYTIPLPINTPPLTPTDELLPHSVPTQFGVSEMVPTSYVFSIPCFLCQEPFNDIESLKKHLYLHTSHQPVQSKRDPPTFKCVMCGREMRSQAEVDRHKILYHGHRLHNSGNEADKPFKCEHCSAAFNVKGFLRCHLKTAHPGAANGNSADSATSSQKMTVYNTNLINALAAANYNPATETVAKYLPPTPPSIRRKNSWLKLPPKRKYAPRSPFFNPNLWFDNDSFVL